MAFSNLRNFHLINIVYSVSKSRIGTAVFCLVASLAVNGCAKRTSPSSSDPGFRVVVSSNQSNFTFPSPDQDWDLQYQFVVPPLPSSSTWNYQNQTFYIWGDVDFDYYGANGNSNSISNYVYNQIVPQLILGWGGTVPTTDDYTMVGLTPSATWFIQADYFWQNANGTTYQQAGEYYSVNPGEVLTSEISYSSSTGKITAQITAPASGELPTRTSVITIDKPFPNESNLFTSWKDFFEQAINKSSTSGPIGRPVFNVESHWVDSNTLCSVLPIEIQLMSLPNVTWESSNFNTSASAASGSYSCTGSAAQLADLVF